MSGQDPNSEIEELKERLRRHEIKIQELEQQLQEDRDSSTKKIKELQDEKKRLENEVSELKKKIQWLEDEVRYFSTKPVITDLKSQLEKKDGEINHLKTFCEKMEISMKNELLEVKSQMQVQSEKMGGEIRSLFKERDDTKTKLDEYMRRTEKLEKSRNMLFIGQLCAKVMEAVYWEVLPVYFKRGDDYKQPHLRAIDDKIDELCPTGRDKGEAREKWRKLQAEIDEGLVEFMEKMLDQRHKEAHPFPLNENELKEIARDLPGQEQHHLEKVIQLWFTDSRFQVPG